MFFTWFVTLCFLRPSCAIAAKGEHFRYLGRNLQYVGETKWEYSMALL